MVDSATSLVSAAQYIRMSTEHQRYSADNQVAAIEIYAAAHGYDVVKTYADLGKSGLTLKGRPALKQLLSDVEGRDAPFKAVLVYDVSRWGRFLDPDEAAACEATCKRVGIAVHYCAEVFENDGSAVASMLKSLKRIMAAEYSRELSDKVAAAQRRMASFGFTPSRWRPLGVRRLAVDHRGQPVRVLDDGERGVRGCHVAFIPGPPQEMALVRRIFRLYGERGWTLTLILRTLRKEGLRNPHGDTDWTFSSLQRLLKNEIYVGNYVFGKTTARLSSPHCRVAPDQWVRAEGVIEPIISRALFDKVQQRLAKRVRPTDAKLLDDLRMLIARHGHVSCDVLRRHPGASRASVYIRRFGSLTEAYRRVGYDLQSRRQASALMQASQILRNDLALMITDLFRADGHKAAFNRTHTRVRVDGAFDINVRSHRPFRPRQQRPLWTYQAGRIVTVDLTLLMRLDDELRVVDYCLMTPEAFGGGGFIYLPEVPRPRRGLETFASLDDIYGRCLRMLGRDSQREFCAAAPAR